MVEYEHYKELFSNNEERLWLRQGLKHLIEVKIKRSMHGTAKRINTLKNKLEKWQQQIKKEEKTT